MDPIGPYAIVRELGRGAMGVVYLARHTELGREVALKVLQGHGEATPESAERFRREAQAAAQLAGMAGLVGVHDVGVADGVPWIAMDFVRGRGVDDAIAEGELAPGDSARLMSQIARAVHRAHAVGILHRDLKPANILIDEAGQPWVTDFGLARQTRADADATRLTKSEEILGTPAYMPPEQAMGRPLDVRADVYALGATLYEMLTEQPPFQADSIHGVLAQVLRQPPRPMASIRAGVPRELEQITRCCLAKEPGDRYADAAALADDLDRFVAGERIVAQVPSAVQRLGRQIARRPVVVVGGLLVAITAGGAVWWSQREARHTATSAGGITAAATDTGRADLAQRLSSAYHALALETAQPMSVLSARFGGVPVEPTDVEAALASVRVATERQAAALPDGGLPGAWYGLALHFAGDSGAPAQLAGARAAAGEDPFPALVSAMAEYATYVRDLELPSAVIGTNKTTLGAYAESEAQRGIREMALEHLAGVEGSPVWARLAHGGELAGLAAGANALATERYAEATAALSELRDAPLFGPAAAALRGLALYLLARPAEAAADWERAESSGWAHCADHAAMAWLAAGTMQVAAETDPGGHWDRGLAAMGRSIAREPGNWSHFHVRGILQMQWGRETDRRGGDPRPAYRSAEQDLLHVVALQSANGISLNALGVVRRQLGFAQLARGERPVKSWLESILAFDKALAIVPGKIEVHRERAYTHAKLGHYLEQHSVPGGDPERHYRVSIADSSTVLATDGHNAGSHDTRAFARQRLALRLGATHPKTRELLEGAVSDARAATTADPSDPGLWQTLALVIDTLNSLAPALGLDHVAMLREQARIADASSALHPGVFGPRYCRALVGCYLARVETGNGDARRAALTAAIALLDAALALNPRHAPSLVWRGGTRRELSALQGRGGATTAARIELLQAAFADLEIAVSEDPKFGRARGERAMVRHELAKFTIVSGGDPTDLLTAAAADAAEAVRLQPNYWAFRAARMFVLQTHHDFVVARRGPADTIRPLRNALIEAATGALAGKPNMLDALWVRGVRLRERANERITAGQDAGIVDLQESIADFAALIRLQPADPRGYINRASGLRLLADIHVNNGKDATPLWTQMLGDAETAGAQSPRAWRPLTLQGLALAGLGRRDAARTALERAIAIHPNNPMARRALQQLGGK